MKYLAALSVMAVIAVLCTGCIRDGRLVEPCGIKLKPSMEVQHQAGCEDIWRTKMESEWSW